MNNPLESELSPQVYSISNRGLKAGIIETVTHVKDCIAKFEKIGVDFFLWRQIRSWKKWT